MLKWAQRLWTPSGMGQGLYWIQYGRGHDKWSVFSICGLVSGENDVFPGSYQYDLCFHVYFSEKLSLILYVLELVFLNWCILDLVCWKWKAKVLPGEDSQLRWIQDHVRRQGGKGRFVEMGYTNVWSSHTSFHYDPIYLFCATFNLLGCKRCRLENRLALDCRQRPWWKADHL